MQIFTGDPLIWDPNTPLYQQLFAHLQAAILTGRLPGGQRLPSTRALADELQISRNTVLNAYEQLTSEGYLKSGQGSGTFVTGGIESALKQAKAATGDRDVLLQGANIAQQYIF